MPHRRTKILNRWTEYCYELYNHKANGDPSVLDCSQRDREDDHPTLRKEVEAAVQSPKKGKSTGVNKMNIPAELVQAGGEDVITALTTISDKIWQTGEWPTPWTQSLVITLPKKCNLQQCQNYKTISLISHPSKVTLKIILNWLKPQAEQIIAVEQAGLRAGRSTAEQIFNLRLCCTTTMVQFKKAFNRVWHAAMRAIMKKYISANLIWVIKNLCNRAISAILVNSTIGDWFQTTAGVQQECLLSPTLFNIFLERTMTHTSEDHKGTISIGSRTFTNLHFADDINVLAGEEEEQLGKLANISTKPPQPTAWRSVMTRQSWWQTMPSTQRLK